MCPVFCRFAHSLFLYTPWFTDEDRDIRSLPSFSFVFVWFHSPLSLSPPPFSSTLSNDDFRKFIKQASAARPAATPASGTGGTGGSTGKKRKREDDRAPPPRMRSGDGSDDDEDSVPSRPASGIKPSKTSGSADKYRDRAAERRKVFFQRREK